MRADAMQAEFQRSGGRVVKKTLTNTECTAIFYHDVHAPEGLEVTFSLEDARRAGLADRPVWRAHPRSMLWARVITTGIRRVLPGVIMGIYTPDEIEEFMDVRPVEKPRPRQRVNASQHRPVAQVVSDLKSHNQAAEAATALCNEHGWPAAEKPPESPKSDFRVWVEQTVEPLNAELQKRGLKPITPYQVANHIVKEAIKSAMVDEHELLGVDGKRDKKLVAARLRGWWEDDPAWIGDIVGPYLAEKFAEATESQPPPAEASNGE
jgi:hypothetical protein